MERASSPRLDPDGCCPAAEPSAAAVLLGANVTTHVLKPGLGRLDPLGAEAARDLVGSFPSGHATVAASLGLALMLVVPRRLVWLAALLGLGYAAGVGAALLALGWHYPSDVAGGYLVATAWAGAAAAVLAWRDRRPPPRRRRPLRYRPSVRVGAAVLGGAALVFLVLVTAAFIERPDLVQLARLRTLFFVAVGCLAALSALVFASVAALLLRRPVGGGAE